MHSTDIYIYIYQQVLHQVLRRSATKKVALHQAKAEVRRILKRCSPQQSVCLACDGRWTKTKILWLSLGPVIDIWNCRQCMRWCVVNLYALVYSKLSWCRAKSGAWTGKEDSHMCDIAFSGIAQALVIYIQQNFTLCMLAHTALL